ncbi:MAG TPA: hypothetical protein VFH03_15850 [Actinoplanes sp.]|nr:hypothetical protein [Actinoplanes sp.]
MLTTLRKEMIAVRVRVAALLASSLVVSAIVAAPAPARAAAAGVEVTITELPDEFEAGAEPRTVEVVASTERERGRQRCRKIRWSLVLRVTGADLDQVQVDRIEENGSFPVRVQTRGDTARLTDIRLDPGRLCPDRTVTARYRVAFDDDTPTGEVSFRAQAFGTDNRLLQSASGASRVTGENAEPSPSPSDDAPSEVAAAPPAPDTGDPELSASAGGGTPSLLGPGLIIGAVLVFLGVGLLLRIRLRNRGAQHRHRPVPRSVYPAP